MGLLELMLACFLVGAFWDNLPTCNLREPVFTRCREVRGVFGGVIDARIHEPAW
jgi:hypothetical protein